MIFTLAPKYAKFVDPTAFPRKDKYAGENTAVLGRTDSPPTAD